jgi:hypothetical protein
MKHIGLITPGIIGLVLVFPTLLIAEVPILNNPFVPPVQRTIEMEEIWRIGDNEDEVFMFGVIGQVFSDEEGNFYLLDTQLHEVFKFSPEGRYLKSVTQNGEGPGEINMCYFCDFWDEASIGCINIFPKAIVRFDADGLPLSNLKATPMDDLGSEETISLFRFSRRDGFMVGYGQHFIYENGESNNVSFLSVFDDQVNEIHRFAQQPTGYNFRKPITVDEEGDFVPHGRWALGNGGEIYLVPDRTGFLVEVRDLQGNLLRKISREWEMRKRTKEEKDEAKNQWTFGSNGVNIPEISYRISDYPRTIGYLDWIDGQLWVTTSETAKKSLETNSRVVDVFDPAGHLLEERTYRLPYDKEKDQVHWLSHGRAVVVKNIRSARMAATPSDLQMQTGEGKEEFSDEEDSILEVILYRVKN